VPPNDRNIGMVFQSYTIWPLTCRISDGASIGDVVKVAVRPENVALSPTGAALDGNVTEGEVEAVTFLGNMLDCVVAAGDRTPRRIAPAGGAHARHAILI